jgi:hypothetical protein
MTAAAFLTREEEEMQFWREDKQDRTVVKYVPHKGGGGEGGT